MIVTVWFDVYAPGAGLNVGGLVSGSVVIKPLVISRCSSQRIDSTLPGWMVIVPPAPVGTDARAASKAMLSSPFALLQEKNAYDWKISSADADPEFALLVSELKSKRGISSGGKTVTLPMRVATTSQSGIVVLLVSRTK